MKTGLISHPGCLGHAPPPGHPESPDRLRAVLRALEGAEFAALDRDTAIPADRNALLAVHTPAHVDAILGRLSDEAARDGFAAIDADTFMSQGSAEAARLAAGTVIRAVDRVASGEIKNAFCAVRPPGHHAPSDRAMGFCLFNNVAIGAFHARRIGISEKVAVIDFDVHHGNGTQDIFFAEPDLFYASTHQMPLYPGTGSPREHGIANNILNVPLAPYSGSAEFRSAMTDVIIPALDAFAPGFIFLSAGFDAHDDDPLAQLRLTDEDFGWATARLCEAARRLCGGRVVSTLEGGYDLDALGRSAAAHVRALMEA
ncbi:MAG TPA: histone deacetylase family protein [Rhizomicrobium sp.]